MSLELEKLLEKLPGKIDSIDEETKDTLKEIPFDQLLTASLAIAMPAWQFRALISLLEIDTK